MKKLKWVFSEEKAPTPKGILSARYDSVRFYVSSMIQVFKRVSLIVLVVVFGYFKLYSLLGLYIVPHINDTYEF